MRGMVYSDSHLRPAIMAPSCSSAELNSFGDPSGERGFAAGCGRELGSYSFELLFLGFDHNVVDQYYLR